MVEETATSEDLATAVNTTWAGMVAEAIKLKATTTASPMEAVVAEATLAQATQKVPANVNSMPEKLPAWKVREQLNSSRVPCIDRAFCLAADPSKAL